MCPLLSSIRRRVRHRDCSAWRLAISRSAWTRAGATDPHISSAEQRACPARPLRCGAVGALGATPQNRAGRYGASTATKAPAKARRRGECRRGITDSTPT